MESPGGGGVSERDGGGERELRPQDSSGSRYEQLSFAVYPWWEQKGP